jgi:hypothetical protein
MIGSLASMMGYWIVLFVLVVWMVVKIARSSPLLAVGSFLFWPLSLLALVKYWGDRDSDIRVPFFLSVLCTGLIFVMANRAMDKAISEGAIYLSDEDIALIAEDDPELAAQLAAAREEAIARGEVPVEFAEEEGDVEAAGEGAGAAAADLDGVLARISARREAAARPAAEETGFTRRQDRRLATPVRERAAVDSAALRAEVARVAWRFSSQVVEEAHARLRLPRGFRFLPRQALPRIARLRGVPLDRHVVGWAVHQQVDLAAADAWVVEVHWVEAGHMPLLGPAQSLEGSLPLLAASSLRDGSGRLLGEGDYAPTWRADDGVLTWSVHDDPLVIDPRADLVAAWPLRHGVLLFVVPQLGAGRHELGLRAARLLARRVEVEPQWRHADHRPREDLAAGISLLDWAAGAAPKPAPAAG